MDAHAAAKAAPIQRKTSPEPGRRDNKTGQPDQLKSESRDIKEDFFSGLDLNDIEVITGLDLNDIEVIRGVEYPKAESIVDLAEGVKDSMEQPMPFKKDYSRFYSRSSSEGKQTTLEKLRKRSISISEIEKDLPDENYNKGAAFLMKFRKKTIKQPKMRFSDDYTMALRSGDPKEFFGTRKVFDKLSKEAPVDFHLFSSMGITVDEENKETHLYKIVPIKKDSKEVKSEIIDLSKHVCIELASYMMGMTGDFYSHDIVTKKGRIPMKTFPAHGDKKTLNSVSKKMWNKKRRDKKYGFNQHAFPDIGQAYATFAMGQTDPGFGYHFGTVVAKSESENTNLTLENINRTSLTGSMQGKLFEEIKKLAEKDAADFEYDDEQPARENLRNLIKHLYNVSKNTADHMRRNILGSLGLGSTWYFGLYRREMGTWTDKYKGYFDSISEKQITLVMAKPEKES